MRYIIIGAGAIGATIGALLHESSRDVVLVARGEHLDVLRSKGLRFFSPRGTETVQIPAVGGPEELELRRDDVLLLCVKGQDTADVLTAWADRPVADGSVAEPAAGDAATGDAVSSGEVAGGAVAGGAVASAQVAAEVLPVVCAQNGVDNERTALRRFAHVYGMSVLLPAEAVKEIA